MRCPFADIAANNFNLDIKNPNAPNEVHGDFDELLATRNQMMLDLADARDTLKGELMKALHVTAETKTAQR